MTDRKRDASAQPVEMLSADPDRFATGHPVSASATLGAPRRPRLLIVGAAGVVVSLIATFAAWHHSPRSSLRVSVTSTSAAPVVDGPSTTLVGRDAPTPTVGEAFALVVEPSPVAAGSNVTMRLEGDLSEVSSPIAAVAWVDQRVTGNWRTTHWMARSPGASQRDGIVSGDPFGPSPDAVTFGADQPVRFDLDVLVPGDYRLCRYVPLRAIAVVTVPASNPAYVCAPLTVGAS